MRSSKAISAHPSFECVSTADCSSCPDVEETDNAVPEWYERCRQHIGRRAPERDHPLGRALHGYYGTGHMMASLALRVKFVDSNDVLGDSTTSTHKISKSGIARLHDLG